MHYRQTIRDAVRARLTAAATLAGPNVFTSRARPILEILQKREAVLSIYTEDETSASSPDGHNLVRTLTISIEGAVGGGDDLDDVLDDFAEQVEAAIDSDPTLGTLLSEEMELQATTSQISARGNQQVGAFRMDYGCTYITGDLAAPVVDGLWPEHPLPTEVTINPRPTPQAYVQPVNSADVRPPAAPTIWGDEPEIVPNQITLDVVSPARAPEPPKAACADGSCDIPAWTGDPA